MQNRIDRLEGLVLSLMTNGSPPAGPATAMEAISGSGSGSSVPTRNSNSESVDEDEMPTGPEESDTEQVTKSFGVMKVDNNKSYYISDSHWASVLSEVSFDCIITDCNILYLTACSYRSQRSGTISVPTKSSTKSMSKSCKQTRIPPMSPGQHCCLVSPNRRAKLRSWPHFHPSTSRIC